MCVCPSVRKISHEFVNSVYVGRRWTSRRGYILVLIRIQSVYPGSLFHYYECWRRCATYWISRIAAQRMCDCTARQARSRVEYVLTIPGSWRSPVARRKNMARSRTARRVSSTSSSWRPGTSTHNPDSTTLYSGLLTRRRSASCSASTFHTARHRCPTSPNETRRSSTTSLSTRRPTRRRTLRRAQPWESYWRDCPLLDVLAQSLCISSVVCKQFTVTVALTMRYSTIG